MQSNSNSTTTTSSGIETIVKMNANGRITIPADVRRFLDLENSKVSITVHHDQERAGTIIAVGEDGRATLSAQTRRYLGIDGTDTQLKIVIDQHSVR